MDYDALDYFEGRCLQDDEGVCESNIPDFLYDEAE